MEERYRLDVTGTDYLKRIEGKQRNFYVKLYDGRTVSLLNEGSKRNKLAMR